MTEPAATGRGRRSAAESLRRSTLFWSLVLLGGLWVLLLFL